MGVFKTANFCTSLKYCLVYSTKIDDIFIIQEGNTPYSLALSGNYTETANFVMTYASKAPQKQDTGPTKMTIFDLQVTVY